jgi:hypothetical protein
MDEKPKRSWFRCTLRTWFVAMTALCLWLGWWSQSAMRQKRAVEQLRAMQVVYHYEIAKGTPNSLSQRIERLLGVDFVRNVEYVRQERTLTHAGRTEFLHVLGDLPRLRVVWLFARPCATDDDLRILADYKQLTSLNLVADDVSDFGITHLSTLSELVTLRLVRPHISADGIKGIGEMANLKRLALCEVQLNDESLWGLCSLKKLKALRLQLVQVDMAWRERLKHALPDCQISYD